MTLGCAGFGHQEEMMRLEIHLKQTTMELLEAEDANAVLEARLATCNCPDLAPAPPPVPTVIPAAVIPAAAPTPAPVPIPTVSDNTPGQIEVSATSTVKVLVDGKGCNYNLAKSVYLTKNLTPGVHMVEVRGTSTGASSSHSSSSSTTMSGVALSDPCERLGLGLGCDQSAPSLEL
jgi:hypothetical protein